MGGIDLIFMACMFLGPTADCQKKLADCANDKQAQVVSKYMHSLKSVEEKPRDIMSMPAPDWHSLVMQCASEQLAKKPTVTTYSADPVGEDVPETFPVLDLKEGCYQRTKRSMPCLPGYYLDQKHDSMDVCCKDEK